MTINYTPKPIDKLSCFSTPVFFVLYTEYPKVAVIMHICIISSTVVNMFLYTFYLFSSHIKLSFYTSGVFKMIQVFGFLICTLQSSQ